MAKVWVMVPVDEYEPKVLLAFSSKDAADAHFDKRSQYAALQEIELDTPSEVFGPLYVGVVGLESGRMRDDVIASPLGEQFRDPKAVFRVEIQWALGCRSDNAIAEQAVCVFSPQSKRHAISVAFEKRREWLATGAIAGIHECCISAKSLLRAYADTQYEDIKQKLRDAIKREKERKREARR